MTVLACNLQYMQGDCAVELKLLLSFDSTQGMLRIDQKSNVIQIQEVNKSNDPGPVFLGRRNGPFIQGILSAAPGNYYAASR